MFLNIGRARVGSDPAWPSNMGKAGSARPVDDLPEPLAIEDVRIAFHGIFYQAEDQLKSAMRGGSNPTAPMPFFKLWRRTSVLTRTAGTATVNFAALATLNGHTGMDAKDGLVVRVK